MVKRDRAREQRIVDEIIVDASPDEQAMGWYYYLEDNLRFSFSARCRVSRATSPLRVGDRVTVIAIAPEEECEHEMFVAIRWQKRRLAVPLAQLEVERAHDVDLATREAVEDWNYWIDQGYTF